MPWTASQSSLFRLITIYTIGRQFIQPSGSHTPLAGVYKHALAGISILRLVRHSSSLDGLSSAIHASSVITQFSLSLASALLGEDVPNHNHKMFIQTHFILSFTSSSGVRAPKK
ncbi:hypothetical protein ATANTOWER_013943 [Ataeniobius toweri]|uniref:NADH:ubiquinone reductase (H(+)-translocating) n=1 Tax=Ataeniobius toweri TaxID=208326 RepID=A0ABU7AH06_9TELE|nr:hypothetical protein [Ataeniobius toweri]